MLDPPLVRRITSQMIRRVGHKHPVTVKCRIGADDRDQYEHLCEFIHEVRSAGVQKFIGNFRSLCCLLIVGCSLTQVLVLFTSCSSRSKVSFEWYGSIMS